ncbi:hypothetical protein NDU88_002947 [Pleurodeles waltl]|uniref:Secreted protein n=1 Tax=Pleurodeles waltl TaxID=8319 RepID=A0AAV7VER9_PLEWA|nr:hypothetical protein NDU88_002947 [Pleurodeles waltl]
MRPFRRSWGRGAHTAIGWMCWPAVFDSGTRPVQRLGEAPGGRLRHWDVPRWSSVGCEEARRGFPFGGIRAEPALARLLGGCPRSLKARQHV